MTDIQKLKALAQKQINPANWFKPGEKVEGLESEDLEFIAAANPALVLELISQIEGLHAQHGRDSGELRKICSARDSARRQRDQLKAENTDLHATLQAAKGEIERLKGESEALRNDAERYLFLRDGDDELVAAVAIGKDSITFLGGIHADQAVDAAMSKEASHD